MHVNLNLVFFKLSGHLQNYIDTKQVNLKIFVKVANALAVAEEAFMFEHRDLHWGNVLVSKCKNKEITFITRDEKRTIKLYGVKVSRIIL